MRLARPSQLVVGFLVETDQERGPADLRQFG
jgi:hypothetical protein